MRFVQSSKTLFLLALQINPPHLKSETLAGPSSCCMQSCTALHGDARWFEVVRRGVVLFVLPRTSPILGAVHERSPELFSLMRCGWWSCSSGLWKKPADDDDDGDDASAPSITGRIHLARLSQFPPDHIRYSSAVQVTSRK